MPGPDSTQAWPQPDGLTVRGGSAPTFADLDELRAAAHALLRAAGRLEDAEEQVMAARNAVGASTAESPATAGPVNVAIWGMTNGSKSFTTSASALRTLASGLQTTAAKYEDAEADASAAVRRALITAGHIAGENPLLSTVAGLWLATTALTAGLLISGWRWIHGEPAPSPTTLFAELPLETLMPGLAAYVRALEPGQQRALADPVPDASRLMLNGVALGSTVYPDLRWRPLAVTRRLGSTTKRPAATSVSELPNRIREHYATAGAPPGTIGIDRIDHPDGSRSWVVLMPGTEDGGFGQGSNPRDMATNLQLSADIPDQSSELVQQALAQAGVKSDEPIVLAGHSQGGMAAVQLASNAAFLAKYNVAAVVTAGSPASAAKVPVRIPTLQFENLPDAVPAIDGKPSAAGPTHVVVTRDLAQSSDPADRKAAHDPIAAHDPKLYERTAEIAAASGNESVREFDAKMLPLLGGPGTTTEHTEYTGFRIPDPQTITPVGKFSVCNPQS